MPELDPRWAAARNVLVARLDNLGDVLMCGPALRAVRDALPEARLTLWASPGGRAAAELLPVVDAVLPARVVWQDLGRMALDPGRELALVEELRARAFDAALVFTSFAQSPYPPGYVCYLAGVPRRAGQSREFGGGVLTDWVRPLPDEAHQVDRNLHLVESLGFAVASRELFAVVPPAERELARQRLGGSPYLVLHPAASCPARTYSPAGFASAGRELARRTGLRVAVTGSARERPLSEALAAEIGPAAVAIAGETTFAGLAAVVAGAALVVANNTSVMHLADALRTPSVILFAGTELESQWRPRSARAALLRRETWCSPCYRFECPYNQECLDVPPGEVVEAALEVLRGG